MENTFEEKQAVQNEADTEEKKLLSPYLSEAMARGGVQEVELPGFGDGRPWVAKLRRISLLDMARCGHIPNPLLGAVSELYMKGKMLDNDLKLSGETMRLMAREALAEPTLEELDAAGVVLSDLQQTAIYLYAQRGAEALAPFRQKAPVLDALQDSGALLDTAERAAGTD